MSRTAAEEVFEGAPDLVYEYLLFFFLMNQADPKLLSFGQLDSREIAAGHDRGGYILKEWQYPVRLVVEARSGPTLGRQELRVVPFENKSMVTWAFSFRPTNLLGRVLTARERRYMTRLAKQNLATPSHHANIVRLKHDFEHRRESGLDDAFQDYCRRLRMNKMSDAP